MTVIAEVQCPLIEDKFVVHDVDTADELKDLFVEAGLKDLYELYVRHLSK